MQHVKTVPQRAMSNTASNEVTEIIIIKKKEACNYVIHLCNEN